MTENEFYEAYESSRLSESSATEGHQNILTLLKYQESQMTIAATEEQDQQKPSNQGGEKKQSSKIKSIESAASKQTMAISNLDEIQNLRRLQRKTLPREQARLVKATDYTPDGKSPIVDSAEFHSLTSMERQALDPSTAHEVAPLTEEQLLRVIEKCNNYDLNVQRHKIDLRYIQELRACIGDFQRLKDIVPAGGKAADAQLLTKVSKLVEKKIKEIFELIRKNKQNVIPMDLLG